MRRLMILLLFLGVGFPYIASADLIIVSGDVSGTWSADTVLVTGEIRVPPGETLVIEPGVEVLFQVYCKFIVDSAATLLAVGTEQDSILFDEYIPGTHWHGIRFLSASDSSRLEYCHLTNGLATGGGEDEKGGGIYCTNSSPTIRCNTISGNSASSGGGIYCFNNSSPIISLNTLVENSADYYGGAICCFSNSNPIINENTITSNSAFLGGGITCFASDAIVRCNEIIFNTSNEGGGIHFEGSSPVIEANIVAENFAFSKGGGIYAEDHCETLIYGNIISGNLAFTFGGGICFYTVTATATITNNCIFGNSGPVFGAGIFCFSDSATITYNAVINNTNEHDGGGIYLASTNTIINKNSIVQNESGQGGGLHVSGSTLTLINSIMCNNVPEQIHQFVGNIMVGYSNIQGSWPGIGNIDEYPAFVDTTLNDYRLLWGSPCIDSGNPHPQHNDPDGTRADMGAFYYDQSMPVRILLTPHEIPYLIPETGGSMDYTIRATNIDSVAQVTIVWCDATLPDSIVYGPVLGPVTVTLGAGTTIERIRTQAVPGAAPMGVYHYNAYAVVGADTSKDSFMFGKLGTTGGDRTAGWANSGDPLVGPIATIAHTKPSPKEFSLCPAYPNPFNATTTIRFDLPVAGWVKLEVFDIGGREVGSAQGRPLREGWMEAGSHEVTFDGLGLASGVYIYRLTVKGLSGSGATPTTINKKMVLLK